MFEDSRIRIADITAGTSNTALLAEQEVGPICFASSGCHERNTRAVQPESKGRA